MDEEEVKIKVKQELQQQQQVERSIESEENYGVIGVVGGSGKSGPIVIEGGNRDKNNQGVDEEIMGLDDNENNNQISSSKPLTSVVLNKEIGRNQKPQIEEDDDDLAGWHK